MSKTKNKSNISTARGPNHFGDKRDVSETPHEAGCTSTYSFSTMPRRQR